MPPRKLCFFLNSYTYGGVEEHVVLMCSLLPQLGYTPFVVCSKHTALQALYDRLDALGVRRTWFEPRAGVVGKARSIAKLSQLLRDEQVELLHLQLIFSDGGRVPLLAGALAGVPMVVTHHAAPRTPQGRLTRLARGQLLELASRFIAVSHANR